MNQQDIEFGSLAVGTKFHDYYYSGGSAVINEEDDDFPYCECGNDPMEDELASNQCACCGKALS